MPARRQPSGPELIDAHLSKVPEPQRSTLEALRRTIRDVLPHADECIKYGMPSFTVQGKGVAAFDAFKQHCSYFPFSGSVIERVGDLGIGVAATRGTLRFPIDRPLSKGLVKRLVRARLDQISDVTNGTRYDFYDDGAVKAAGRVKAGMLHGDWKWYRRDGTLMRTGRFREGEPTGIWETWDVTGTLVKRVTRG